MITIEIKKLGEMDFVDRTDQIRSYSLSLGTTKEASTGRLEVNAYGSKYVPDGEDEVRIYDGEDVVFGGFIVRVAQRVEQGPVVIYECELKNKVHRLDYKLVNVSFENETAHDIIDTIVEDFSGPGITTNNVEDDASAVITSIVFNNVPPSEAIQQIADLFGKEWYVDEEGDIHFFSKLSEAAPFNLTDTNGKASFDSIEIVKDYTQIRNSVLVEGGEELSQSEESDSFLGDGTTHTFSLSRKYADITVEVEGVPQTVGIANINTFADKDVLYDFALRSLQFNPSSPPAGGDEIVVSGKYYFAIMVRFRESSSISIYGEKQFFIQDSTLKSRSDAIARASAELAAYARNVNEGSFETYEAGLKPGQKIRITSTIRGIDEDFVIQRVSGRYHTPEKMVWNVEIVSVKSYELIDLLAEIIRGRRKESNPNAVIGVAERVERELGLDREILTYFNDPPIWVAGPYAPTSLADRKRVAFADRTCLLPN
jgi:hypothetical protein